jgi:Txe/YoeB family toxin of Txe-Axe toxin-antitoxin module
MEIEFSPTVLKDLSQIKRSHSNAFKNRLTRILQSIEESPFSGFASPEALKYELSGKW